LFRVLARFAFIRNPSNDASPLQMTSVHRYPSCDGSARDAEECEKRVWSKKT